MPVQYHISIIPVSTNWYFSTIYMKLQYQLDVHSHSQLFTPHLQLFIHSSFWFRKQAWKRLSSKHRMSCRTTMHPHVVRLQVLMSYVHSNSCRTTWQPHKNSHRIQLFVVIQIYKNLGSFLDHIDFITPFSGWAATFIVLGRYGWMENNIKKFFLMPYNDKIYYYYLLSSYSFKKIICLYL